MTLDFEQTKKAVRIRELSDEELVNVYELFKMALQSKFINIIAKVEPPIQPEQVLQSKSD